MEVLLNADFFPESAPEGASELLDLVDLANVACSPRSRNALALRSLAKDASLRGVRIGALVRYFGGEVSARELTSLMEEEIGSVRRLLGESGGAVQHVKLHGLLADLSDEHSDLAEACVDWMESELEGTPLVVRTGGLLHAVAEARGVPLLREITAGRSYVDEARLMPPDQAKALIEDAGAVARTIAEWKQSGHWPTASGKKWLVEAETVCVTPGMPRDLEIARAVRSVL